MYAIIQAGGKQYQVSPGEIVDLEKIPGEVGEEIALEDVLLVNDDENILVGTPQVDDVSVKAKILEQGRDKKITVFKMKRRKQYRRKQGHRQEYTRLRITDIITPGGSQPVSEPEAESALEETESI